MELAVRKFQNTDLPSMVKIWNHVVEEANAFPQVEKLTEERANYFFESQTFTGVAIADNQISGLYILHPNNVGRCGHIANASYAVDEKYPGFGLGEKLVRHSMKIGRKFGFSILQFNAVVNTNTGAIHLYERM